MRNRMTDKYRSASGMFQEKNVAGDAMHKRKQRRILRGVSASLGCVLAAFMFFTLMKPAITLEKNAGMEPELVCALEEHVHTDACLGYDHEETEPVYGTNRELVCSFVPHVHDEACLDENGMLICGLSDVYYHVHDEYCFDHGTLVCTLTERAREEDLEQVQVLVCEKEESQGHVHSQDCYTSMYFTDEDPICGMEEGGAHVHTEECFGLIQICELDHEHTDACFAEGLICPLAVGESHVHTLECYPSIQVLICGLEETEGHVHTADCYVMETREKEEHVHTEACLENGVYICGQTEVWSHQHTPECWQDTTILISGGHIHNEECLKVLICGKEEHVHTEACWKGKAEEIEKLLAVPEQEPYIALEGNDGNVQNRQSMTDMSGIMETGESGMDDLVSEELSDDLFTDGEYAVFEEVYTRSEDESTLVEEVPVDELESGLVEEEVPVEEGESPESGVLAEEHTANEVETLSSETPGESASDAALVETDASVMTGTDQEMQAPVLNWDAENADENPESADDAATVPEAQSGEAEPVQEGEQEPAQFGNVHFIQEYTRLDDGRISVTLGADEGILATDILAFAGIYADEVQIESDIPFLEIGKDYFACRFAFDEGTVTLTAGDAELTVLCRYAAAPEAQPDNTTGTQQDAVNGGLTDDGTDSTPVNPEGNENGNNDAQSPEAAPSDSESQFTDTVFVDTFTRLEDGSFEVRLGKDEGIRVQDVLSLGGIEADQVQISSDIPYLEINEDTVVCRFAYTEGTVVITAGETEIRIHCLFATEHEGEAVQWEEPGTDTAGSENEENEIEFFPGTEVPMEQPEEDAADASGEQAAAGSEAQPAVEQIGENLYAIKIRLHESLTVQELIEAIGLDAAAVTLSTDMEALSVEEDRITCVDAFEEGAVMLSANGRDMTLVCRFDSGNLSNDTDAVAEDLEQGTDGAAGSEESSSADETDPDGLNADTDTRDPDAVEDSDPATDGKEPAENAQDSSDVENGQNVAADGQPADEENGAGEDADLNDLADTGDAEAESVRFIQTFETLDAHTFAVELGVNDGVYVRDLPGLEEAEEVSISSDVEAIEAGEDRFICRGAFGESRVILTADEVEITVICRFAKQEASGNTGTQPEGDESSAAQDPEAVQFVQVFKALDEHTYAVELGLNDGVYFRDIPGLEEAEEISVSTEIEAIEVTEDCFICRGAFEEGDVILSSGDLKIHLICRFAEKDAASEEDDHTGDTEPADAASDTDADPEGGISVTGEGAEHVQAMLQPDGSDAVIDLVRTSLQGAQQDMGAQTSVQIWRVFSLSMDEALESPVEVSVHLDIVFQEMLPEGAELISVNWQLYQVSVESGEILPVSDFIIQGDDAGAAWLVFGTDIPGAWTVRCSLAYAAVHETYDLVLDLSGFEADPEADETELGISVVTGERVSEGKEAETDSAVSDGEEHVAELAEGNDNSADPDAESGEEAKADEGTQPSGLGLSVDFAKLLQFKAEHPEADFHGIRVLSEGIPAEKLNPETLSEESSDGYVSYDSGMLRIRDNGTVQIRGQQISLHVHVQGYETPGTQKQKCEYTFGENKTADMQEIFAVSGLSDHFHPVRYAYEVSDPEKVTLTWDGASWKVQANDWFEDVTMSIRRAWYSAVIHLRNPESAMTAGTVISSQDGIVSMTLLEDIQMPADAELTMMPSDGGDLPEHVTEAFAGYSDMTAAWVDIAFGDVKEIHAALTLHGFVDVPESLRGNVSEIKAMVLRVDENGLSILDAKADGTDVVFETDRLSRFCVVWAVKYAWNVDGMSYAWTLTDSGYVSLGSMVESLGMVKAAVPVNSDEEYTEIGKANDNGDAASADTEAGDPQTAGEAGQETAEAEGTESENPGSVSETVRSFLHHVQNVSWANGEIGWAGKTDAETTLGQIREAYGLECIYPAGISDAQIADLDAQSVAEGDWAILRLVPFAGEVVLTVTMDNGETFAVSMTDAIIPQTVVLSAQGDTYGIRVSCGPEAGIPETAALVVREIVEEDASYTEYLDRAYAHVNGSEKQNTDMAEGEADGRNGYAVRQKIRYARFFDIQIWDGDVKIDPKSPVNVQIRLSDAPKDAEHLPEVIHFAEDGPETLQASAKTAETEAPALEEKPMLLMKSTGKKLAKAAAVPAATEEPTVIEFSASGFSVYSVVYTVDFHWEVNGKSYEFSMPGGGFVSLEHLVEVLGIAESEENPGENVSENDGGNEAEGNASEANGTDGNAYVESMLLNDIEVSETTRQFVADVARVEFSSPALVWAGKSNETTTIGQLKAINGLEIAYSAELTEEQIEAINESTVKAGDWALISMLPFTSEESLTVTMKNGDQFVVKVTDGQIRKTVIDANGDKWEISVTYDDDAQIPDGAELRVREILPEDKDYLTYFNQSLTTIGGVSEQDGSLSDTEAESETESETESENAADSELENATSEIPVDHYARIFDIEIWNDHEKIEPKSEVTVNIRLLDIPEDSELLPHVVHFAEKGAELMEFGEMSEADYRDVQFETDEFSVYSVVYTVDLRYDAESGTLSYEDDKIKVTVSAKENDILPDKAVLIVKEIIPEDTDAADTYAQALTVLANTLREQNHGFSAVKVYDFSIFDNNGNEIEPDGEVTVKIEYKKKPEFKENDGSVSSIQIAHLVEDPSDKERLTVQIMEADIDATALGTVSGAEFATDSFSAYIVFNRNGITEGEPTNLGNYGWIRFNTVGERDTTPNQNANPDSPDIQWGYYNSDGSNLPALNTAWAYRRILQVRLWLPKSGLDSSVYDSDHYNEAATAQYFWVWQNEVSIEEFELPGYEVVHTRMHTAWDEENGREPLENDSLMGSYAVRGYRRSTISDEPGAKNSDLNVLDVYAKPLPQTSGMHYIIRYVHADGSVTDGNVRSLSGGSVSYDASQYKRNGEVYAGTSIITGTEAVDANIAAGTGTITYKSDVSLAKVYVYYKIANEGNGNPDTRGRYDKDENGYYTGAKGLYTDKSAEAVSGKDRQFILNLESWYVDNAASAGLVLDASGSMAWTSGAPEPVILTNEQLYTSAWINGLRRYIRSYSGNYNNGTEVPDDAYIPYALLSQIMDKNKTDNSSMGYSGYHYYLKDERDTVKEYVALGYSDGNLDSNNTWTRLKGSSGYNNGNDTGFATVNRWITTDHDAGGQNEGWYYVNSTGKVNKYLEHTGKSYDGYANSSGVASGPLRFYVKNGNELWVAFWDSAARRVVHSPVYEKREKMFTKMETLQDAVSQFGAIVLGSSPDSEIAMTRFSQNIVSTDTGVFTSSGYLPLLNWTDDTVDVSAALDQSIGSYGGKNRSDDGLTVYEYGLTGQTRTWTGVKAYADYLKDRATAENHKYLIVFTDGKDTNGDADSSTWGDTGTQIQRLKNEGYTIITVMMRSQAMVGNEYTSAKAFLQGIASPGLDGNTSNTSADNKLYFEADSNSTKDVIDAFRRIANKIASGLNGYTVRDYIDPRFNVLNDAGDVLTVLDSNGQFTHATNPDIDAATGLRAFTTPDNKQAYLGYDPGKEMFYVLWKDQEIPATTIGSAHVNPWKSQLRIQAKADFLGGNEILSNGNESGMNQVYYPNSSDSSGMTPVTNNTSYPFKDFPKTTINPATLDIRLSNYEDTVFLGENISPADLYANVQNRRNQETDNRELYFDYLVRAGSKLHNDPMYYVNMLKYASIPENYEQVRVKDRDGNQLESAVVDGSVKGITLTLPYYYLESPGDAASYAGGVLHQGDKVGTITYTWTALTTGDHSLTEGNALMDYVSTTTDTVRYQLSVSYMPDVFVSNHIEAGGNVVNDNIMDNGSARTQTLTGETGTGSLIRDPNGVGAWAQSKNTNEGTNANTQGLAAVHVVDGKIKVIKKIEITQAKWDRLVSNAGDSGLTFTFQLKKNGEEYETITINSKTDNVTLSDGYVMLETSDWVTGLPQGDYTLEETEQPEGFTLKTVTAAAVATEDGGSEFAAPTSGSVTWKIGQYISGTPSERSYADTDFTAEKVKDDNKEVAPDKSANNGKNYLNAQIGKGIVEDEPPKTIDVTLKKVDKANLANNSADLLRGATFTVTKYTNNMFNVKDTSASAWTSTLEDRKEGDSYTLNGIFEFKELPVGFYKVDEVVMPAGYVTMADDPVFEVRLISGTTELEVVLYERNGSAYTEVPSGSTEIARIDAVDTIYIANEPGAVLPSTGGPGTHLIYLVGIMFTCLAVTGLVMKRRSRKTV